MAKVFLFKRVGRPVTNGWNKHSKQVVLQTAKPEQFGNKESIELWALQFARNGEVKKLYGRAAQEESKAQGRSISVLVLFSC
jgi:hypothetical protein